MTFDIAGFHQVAVYRAATQPEDITVPAFPPNLFINDPTNRLALAGAEHSRPWTSTVRVHVLDAGRSISFCCNVTPHFAVDKMYGWVTVK